MGVLPESDVSASLAVDGLRLDLDGPGGEAVPFAGDIFGDADDYNIGDDFQHPEMDAGNGSEGEDLHDDDLTAALHAALEDEWEPERPVGQPAHIAAEGQPVAEEAQPGLNHQFNTTRSAEDPLRHAHNIKIVRYSDKHPTKRAGGTLGRKNATDVDYKAGLAASASNPWAPFTSQVDWEVARWAKLRGAGSTAFSDLLAIEGVSGMYKIIR